MEQIQPSLPTMNDLSALPQPELYNQLEGASNRAYALLKAELPPSKAVEIARQIQRIGECYQELLRRTQDESLSQLRRCTGIGLGFQRDLMKLDTRHQGVLRERDEVTSLSSMLLRFARNSLTCPVGELLSHHARLGQSLSDWYRKRFG